MQLTYKYRLKPTKAQLATISTHLELCRRQYNYRLSERFRWWESTRAPVNACPLTASIVPVEEIYQNIPLTRVQTRDGRKKDESGNPGTSQQCWNCLNKVPKELSQRWHSCQCGESLDRDENSAKLIKKIGLNYQSGGGTPSLKKAFAQKEKEACGLTVLS
ncbi:MAG: helix-turn-helix domain-containing protein [Richelia sp. CSU_2_1]|nr:helix-turn-helix domain-containing protein [Richelia sp. CSU_2_1]